LYAGDRALLPTFRLPALIHRRSANAKWLHSRGAEKDKDAGALKAVLGEV